MGELWAWPSVLKLALLDHLRERGDVLAETRAHRLRGRPAGVGDRSRADGVGEWPAEVHHAFVTRLLQRSRALGAIASSLHRQLDEALARAARRWRTRSAPTGSTRPPQQAGVANLITSLRFIGTFDWSEFFESVSLVEQVLQRDPAGVYSQMDFRSRDRYRHAVEELAAPTGEAQLLLALKSVERARQVHVRTPDDARGARRLSPDRRRPPATFERSVAWQPDRPAARAAAVLCLGHAGLPRHRSPPARRWRSRPRRRLCLRGTAGAARRWRSWRCWRSCRPASWSSSCCSG